jgi:integrase
MRDDSDKRDARKRHKTKRPGVFYREDAGGRRRYVVTYRDSNGRQRWRNVEGGIEEAQATLDDLRGRKRRGERIAPTRATVREVGDAWFAAKSQLREGTRTLYAGNLDHHVYPALGKRRVSTVTEDDVLALIASLREKGKAENTIRNVLSPLSGLLNYAVRRGQIAANPVTRLERDERPSPGQYEKRVLDSDEVARLLDAASETYRPVIATGVYTGLRQSEVLGLTWADVDFGAQMIRVRRQLERVKTRERGEPKTRRSTRSVVLIPELARILREYKARSGHSRDGDFVFSTRDGKPLGHRNVLRGLVKAANAAGLNPEGVRSLTFNDSRRTFISTLIAAGTDVVVVSGQAGHRDASITLRAYAEEFALARHADALRDSLDAAFAGNKRVTTGGDRRRNPEAGEGGKLLNLAEKRAGGDT